MNIDLAPTVTDLVGLTVSPGCPNPPYGGVCSGAFDGRSLVGLLDGSATSWRSDILLEGTDWCAVRTDRYLFARRDSGDEELYDLSADPFELSNLLHGNVSPQTQSVRDELYGRLVELCSPTPPSFSFDVPPPSAPTITGFSPASGPVGTKVTILGTGFTDLTSVTFNGAAASFAVKSSSKVTATVPSGATDGPISVTDPSGSATSGSQFQVTMPGTTVTARDYSFSPKTVTANPGDAVRWSFAGPSTHAVGDTRLLGPSSSSLFASGPQGVGGSYSFTFVAAGSYPYASTPEPTPMKGTVQVPVVVSPSSGTTTTSFSVQWASTTMSGFVFDVSYRFKPAGATTWFPWRAFLSGNATDTTFIPDQSSGTYQFRSRVRNATTGRSSNYSPVTAIAIG